ncbi:MAG: type II secretion system F family protein [Salinirussus sp.]
MTEAAEGGDRWRSVDHGLYVLFSRHADRSRHERDRQRYRAAGLSTGFDIHMARVYGIAWAAGLLGALGVVWVGLLVPTGLVDTITTFVERGLPILNRLPSLPVGRLEASIIGGIAAGALIRFLVIYAASVHLRWRTRVRREDIERTLPGAVRYLRVLASGSNDQRDMLSRVAEQEVYGATAASIRRALNRAALTGSLDEGLSMVARETPSRELLAPFLLKFQEHAAQGSDALERYLRMEGRLLSQREQRRHERASGYLELVAELFVVLLVVPALAVLIVTLASTLAPGLSDTVATPLGSTTVRGIIVYGCAAFVLAVGGLATATVGAIRPTDQATPQYTRPDGLVSTLRSASRNPASAFAVAVPCGVIAFVGLLWLNYHALNALLLAYAAVGIPVGLVAVHRSRIDDAKDREIRDFVHAVSGHVGLGRPLPTAVRRVAEEVELGALQPDVDALAYNLNLTTAPDDTADVRAAALDRFVKRVGTPLASQTIGLVVGALEAGSDTEEVFETLETEIGRLYHERKALRSRLMVYVAVGWTTALLVIGIVVAVNASVLEGFSQLSAVSGAELSLAIDPDAVNPARDRFRFYVVTQATVVACGWFAGMASRSIYESLLHSGLLVTITYVVFVGLGVA